MGFWDWVWGKGEDNRPRPALRVAPAEPPSASAPPPQVVVPSPSVPAFSIDAAIQLMRALPFDDDPDLVMSVVRKTLRSTGLSVEGIVGAAKDRENTLSASVVKDGAAIEQLEIEIAARRTNIERTQKQLAETRSVRERLQEAIENASRVGQSLLPPAEIARLQAEAAAKRSATPSSNVVSPPVANANVETAAPQKSQSPAAPKPSAPPVPKTGAPPPVPKKSFAPKLPGAVPHSSAKPAAPTALANAEAPGAANAGPVAPGADASAALPLLSDDDDVHSEETAKWSSIAPGDTSTPER